MVFNLPNTGMNTKTEEVIEKQDMKILRDFNIRTDRVIYARPLDIVLFEKINVHR